MKRVDILGKKLVYDGFFKVEEARVRYEKYDGSLSDEVRRLSFERGDAVAVLVFNGDSGEVILVEQFRYPTYASGGGWITEVVAGILEEGEEPEKTARREVEEEIGYRVTALEKVSVFYLSPGGSSERIYLYYAEVSDRDRVSAGGGVAGEHEDIRLRCFSTQALDAAVALGEINDAKTLLALLWFKERKC